MRTQWSWNIEGDKLLGSGNVFKEIHSELMLSWFIHNGQEGLNLEIPPLAKTQTRGGRNLSPGTKVGFSGEGAPVES